MDKNEYLKRKKEIENYRMGSSLSKFVGSALLAVSFFLFVMASGGTVAVEVLYLTYFLTAFSIALIILGIWAKSKARFMEIELEVYDKERKRRKAQPIHPVASGPTTQLQYCPSCSKKLQPDWKVCGYCGKGLK